MKNLILPAMIGIVFAACNNEKEIEVETSIQYPQTKTVDQTDTYFGTEIKDPYRWLEDDYSEETKAWVKEQNEVTFNYLDQIGYRENIKQKLKDLWNYEKVSSPFVRGEYTYFYKNDGLQDQSVVYRFKNDASPEEAEVFLDPNEFSEEGTTSLDMLSFSKSGDIAAYSISEGGSDWRKIIILNAKDKTQIGDTLIDVKFSGISWKGDEGFYYSSYDKPKGSELSEKTDQHKLYYHQLNTPQNEDPVVFGGKAEEKHRYISGKVTEDDRFLIISASNATSGNKLYFKDLEGNNELMTILDNDNSNSYVVKNEGDTLFIATDLDAPNQRVIVTNAKEPTPENWSDFIPETENVLSVSTAGNYFFANYMKDATSHIVQYDNQGEKVRNINLPGIGSANGFTAREEETETYFSFSNYITPGSIYKLDLASGESEEYYVPEIDFNKDDYVSEQIFYSSKDGTKVPLIISYKKGIKMNGENPTILYGYGGFNISLTPSFSAANAVWMDMGGIYAVPNLRGGGEYGKKWHDDGTQMKKQNVFDDFIAAATYLIDNNYTSSDYLAIHGGSNGGLLVGATMTQRPELMKVALPAVGVLDMLRYHTFTAGAGWAYDYGTAEDSVEMFNYLLNYSPVHNVKEGEQYPATMITTGDHDDRVVPAHSFKFAAELQAKQAGENPILIRIETDAGHGAGTPISKIIQQRADIYAFTLYNMGIQKIE